MFDNLRRMFDGDGDDEFFRKFVKLWKSVVGQHDRQNVELSSFAFPTKFLTELQKEYYRDN